MTEPLETGAKLTLAPLSDAWVDHVYRVSREHFGVDDVQGAALAEAVSAVSRRYTVERDLLGAGTTRVHDRVARLKFFLLRDLPKLEVPLTELTWSNAITTRDCWRVLDVGAGLGTTSLSVSRAAARLGVQRLEVTALDSDADALSVFTRLAKDVSTLPGAPIELRTRAMQLERAPALDRERGEHGFDLIVIGFVINELWPLADPAARVPQAVQWLTQLSNLLADDGALIVLEPALREQTRCLQAIRDGLVQARSTSSNAPCVVAPCVHDKACPMLANERDWCHVQVPFSLPPRTAELARAAGLRDQDLTFSYLTLRKQPTPNARVSSENVQRVVSAPLSSKGKVELLVCGEPGMTRLMRLDRHRSPANAALSELRRGALVRLPVLAETGTRVRIAADDHVEPLLCWSV